MRKYIPILLISFFIGGLFIVPTTHFLINDGQTSNLLAAPYTLLAPIPGLEKYEVGSGISSYLNAMLKIAIRMAGVLAVLMITIGGIQYMITESFGGKGDAKNRITMAIIGFLLAILSVFILQIINPQLLDFSFLSGVNIKTQTQPSRAGVCANREAGTNCTEAGKCRGLFECKWSTQNQASNDRNCSGDDLEGYIVINDNLCTQNNKPTGGDDVNVYCCGIIDLFAAKPRGPAPKNGCTSEAVAANLNQCEWSTIPATRTNPGCSEFNKPTNKGFSTVRDSYCSVTKPNQSFIILCCGSIQNP